MNARKFFKNFQILKFLFFSFFIFHFSFFIFGCSSSTEISKGDLTGSVYLDGSDDHTGISVALYDLAYLDTTIVRINREYPHIGVIINQHTEFDHRLQSPVATSTTLADGSFIIEDIPTGVYNFVAQKADWGFRYLYEISISEGDNEISNSEFSMLNSQLEPNNPIIQNSKLRINNSPLTLFEELHLSGDVNDNITVAPFHHLVCDDDVTFIPGSSLEIQPNAVVRIAPGADFKIMGNFKAQGQQDGMFWVTSNNGFDEMYNEQVIMNNEVESEDHYSSFIIHSSLRSDSDIALYNSMSLETTCSVENDLIEWGKWDYGNTCLLNQVDNLTMQNGVFREGECGYQISNVDINNIAFCNASSFRSEEHAGIYFYLALDGSASNCIVLDCMNGLKLKDKSNITVSNTFFTKNSYGIKLWQCMGTIEHNILSLNNYYDIGFTGNQEIEIHGLSVLFNNFYSQKAMKQEQDLPYAYNNYSGIYCSSNNFIGNDIFIDVRHNLSDNGFSTYHDYYDGLGNITDIKQRIIDGDDFEDWVAVIQIDDFTTNINQQSGIEE